MAPADASPQIPISSLPSMAFPAMPGRGNATLLGLLFQLEASQWWDAERLRRAQAAQLKQLLPHVWAQVPFYRERLCAAGYDPADSAPMEVLAALPLLGRSDVQDAGPALQALALPKGHGSTHPISTSGSTGRPVRLLGTELTGLLWHLFTIREHLWQRRDFSGRLAAIRWQPDSRAMPPDGMAFSGWGGLLERVYRTGPAGLLNSASDVEAQYAWLRRENPDYLLSHPSNLVALAEHALDKGVSLPALRQVRSVGETVTEKTREACRAAWQVPVIDQYSCQEVGLLAAQCPQGTHYHVQSESVILEVLKKDGTACGPGEIGRVVITSLHNFATPLLRYEIGDYAQVGPPCSCGRGLPVLTRIMGRVRNMLRLPDGRRTWPNFGFKHFAEVLDVRQFQLVQRDLTTLELKLVTPERVSSEQEERLRCILAAHLGYAFDVRISYHEAIPRSTSGKFEDFQSLLDQGW